jgi:hypothetical protein
LCFSLDVAPEAGVEPSCGKGDGTANWINTFDLNELPPEEDAIEKI